MPEEKKSIWTVRLDSFCAVLGGLLPVGLVIGNSGFESIIALVSLIWIIRCLIARNNPLTGLVHHPFFLPWLAWYAGIIVSMIWNGPGSKGWMHDVVLIRYFLYLTAMVDISGRRPVARWMVFGMAAGVVWGLFNTLLAYIIGHDLFGQSLSRYSYKLKTAGLIASLAAYVGPFFITWGTLDRKLSSHARIGVILIGLIALAQVFFVHIRTVEVAVLAWMFVFISYAVFKHAGGAFALLWIIAAGLTLGLIAQFGPKVDLSSTYDRIGYWKVVWAMWREHPIVGVGVSAWQDAYREMALSELISPYISPDGRSWKALEAMHAHNLLLHLISSTGILGVLGFGWLFVQAVRLTIQKRVFCGHALLTWPFVFIVIGLTGWNIYGSQYQTLFAFFMALTGICWERSEDRHAAQNRVMTP